MYGFARHPASPYDGARGQTIFCRAGSEEGARHLPGLRPEEGGGGFCRLAPSCVCSMRPIERSPQGR